MKVYVGSVDQPTLVVQKVGQLDGGERGLWTDSDGDFANLAIIRR